MTQCIMTRSRLQPPKRRLSRRQWGHVLTHAEAKPLGWIVQAHRHALPDRAESLRPAAEAATDRLVQSCLRYASEVSASYGRRYGWDAEDCFQEASVAVLRAVRAWEPWRGVALSTAAHYYIVNALNCLLRATRRQSRREECESLNAPLRSGREFSSLVPAPAAECPGDAEERELAGPRVHRLLAALPASWRFVVSERYGLGGGEPRIFASIAADLNVSDKRAGQIERQAMARLMNAVANEELRAWGCRRAARAQTRRVGA